MPELRKDYLVDEYAIIATERGKRPDQFKREPAPRSSKETCPFCPGNEHMLPSVKKEITKDGAWVSRVVPNKYMWVEPTGNPSLITDNNFFTYASAYGFQEVIIETRNHDEELEHQSEEGIMRVLKLAASRIEEHINKPHIRSVILFKNRGGSAGASLSHPHMQLVAYNNMPPFLKEQLETFYDYYINKDSCPYCEIMNIEKRSFRSVIEDDNFIVFTPYASRFPFEVWLFPKRHMSSMTQLNDQEYYSLASCMKKLLTKLNTLGNPDYNIQFLSADVTEPYHFHVRILTRLAKWAGFEFGTETIVNPMTPEKAAEFYRS